MKDVKSEYSVHHAVDVKGCPGIGFLKVLAHPSFIQTVLMSQT